MQLQNSRNFSFLIAGGIKDEFYSQDWWRKYREHIADAINSYVELQRKGSNYVGVCPFDNHHSPSMSVNQPRQMVPAASAVEQAEMYSNSEITL